MAVEQRQIEDSSKVPSDSDLFIGEVRRNLSERDVFVGDEDFYRLLADSTPAEPAEQAVQMPHTPQTQQKRQSRDILHTWQSEKEHIGLQRFSNLQKMLVAAMIVVGVFFLYAVLKPLFSPADKIQDPLAQQQDSPSAPIAVDPQQALRQQAQSTGPLFPPNQPLSLEAARGLYLKNDYAGAYDVYNQLYQSLPSGADEELLKDFLQLKKALCLDNAGNKEEAKSLFRILSKSPSPVIRVVASYKLCLLQVQEKQFLKARTNAYQAIAIVNAVDFNKDWIVSLQRACNFLVAESMTRNILSLCDAETDIQSLLWSSHIDIDPFMNLDEPQLRELLNSGSEQLKEGLLTPQIRRLEHQGVLSLWSVIAYGASIEELLARFVSNAGLDISWVHENTAAVGHVDNAIRKRPVSLYLTSATARQAIEVAAGHVGLLSHLDEKGLITVSNPFDYSSLSEHIHLLNQETISLWGDFLITFPDDRRIPNAHFAMGLLHTQDEQLGSAIARYKIVANQFSQNPLAPYALLNSSKIKAQLHDYSGARADLMQLVEQYPDTEFYGKACLNLADVTRNAGFLEEAERLYRKVYNLGLSSKLRIASCLGAGRCSFEIQDYENAVKWLIRYIELTNGNKDENFFLAYFLIGKTNLALGNLEQAVLAFQYALSGPVGSLSRERYVETVSALVETYIQIGNFVDAVTLLENVDSWQFSKKESFEILILKSKVLRLMGLPDKAIMVIGDNPEFLPNSQLKTKMSFEIAECYIAKGDLDLADKKLTNILMSAAPGPLANEITLRLAEVCLELDQTSQTITVCRQLLNSQISTQIKQKAIKLLAAAYSRQKNYNDAALALLGQW
jgi:tetratricopeptide (TPR) repeat protein